MATGSLAVVLYGKLKAHFLRMLINFKSVPPARFVRIG